MLIENNIIPADNKELRLEQRNIIETYKEALQAHLGSERGEVDEINAQGLQEYLIGGAYTRVLNIPAGVSIVSELWNRERLWIIVSGTVAVKSEEGDMLIEGPYIGKAPFGSRIALYAETDVLWAAITGVSETEDVTKVEDVVKAKGYSDFTYPWDLVEDQS